VEQDVITPAGLVTIRVGSTVEALGLLASGKVSGKIVLVPGLWACDPPPATL